MLVILNSETLVISRLSETPVLQILLYQFCCSMLQGAQIADIIEVE